MKPIIEPEFYKDFHCIGGQCSFTCCKEWKIAVDPETKKRWRKLSVPETVLESGRVPKHACRSSLDKTQLSQFVMKKDGGEIIELLPNMRCPFLEDTELCRLVLDYGEACLSETCHVFPRETHEFANRTERTIVSCCPEIVDRLYTLKELHFTNLPYQDRAFLLEGNDQLFQIRNIMMYWLSDVSSSNEVNLKRTFFMLLDLLEKEKKEEKTVLKKNAGKKQSAEERGRSLVSVLAAESAADAVKALDPGECLKEADVEKLTEMILAMPKDTQASIEEQNALFLDVTENYRKEGRYQGLLNPLYAMAEQLSREFQEADAARMDEVCALHTEVVAAYAPLLRNHLVAEAFATLLIPGCMLRDMVLQFEWMIMEYVLIVHAMVLEILCEKDAEDVPGAANSKKDAGDAMPSSESQGSFDGRTYAAVAETVNAPLAYPKARELFILIARMTGYDGDEIEEYLSDSFENPVWPWGYADYLLS